jgi:hypothetical protein
MTRRGVSLRQAPLNQSVAFGRAGACHPSTQSYVGWPEGSAPKGGMEERSGSDDVAGGYDGAQDSFGKPPRLASVSESDGHISGGLWLPSPELALSWSMLARGEPRLDLSGYEMHSRRARDGGCDWKTFMEIYCDDYHVEPCHPGLASLADCGQLQWLWAPHGQAQVVGAAACSPMGSQTYAVLARLAQEALGPWARGAVWAALYPGTMIEWLAGGVAISSLEPHRPGACVNHVVFAYPVGVAHARPDFVAAHQRAYWETAREDDEIAMRIQKGRMALAMSGLDQSGPAHPHLEAGIERFHQWLALGAWREGSMEEGFGIASNGGAVEQYSAGSVG